MDAIMDVLCRPTDGVRMLWTGNDGWLLWDGARLVGNDLDLLSENARIMDARVRVEDIAGALKVHFISHSHGDHFSVETCRLLLEKGECLFIVPKSCLETAREVGIPPARMRVVAPGDRFSADGVSALCIRALHGHIAGSVYSGASMGDCGYRFSFGGLEFYQPGDTVLLQEHLEMKGVDVLFVSPTEHNTWVGNSKHMIETIAPRWVFAQHFGTYAETEQNYFWTRGYVRELHDALPPEWQRRLHIPDQETVVEVR